jgi:hypothetical protein
MEPKSNDKLFYTVPFVWDKKLWVMTFAMFALWIGFMGWLLWEIHASDYSKEMIIELIVLNVIMLPLMIVCEGLAPQRLEIYEKKLVILRRYKSVVIHADEVLSIDRLPKNALRGAVRTWGVGGFFGYFGHYYNGLIGAFKLYATSSDNLYQIRLANGKKIVISCSEPELLDKTFKLD